MRRFFLEMKIIYIYYPEKKSTFHSKYLWEIDKQLNKSSHKNFSMWKVIIKWMFKANLNRSAILLEWSQFIQFFLAVFFRFRVSVQRSSRTLFFSGIFPLPSIYSALFEDSTLSFWQTRGTARAAWGQRKSLSLKRSSRTQKKQRGFARYLLAISSTCATSQNFEYLRR